MSDNNSITCVGFILDGNRRFAKKNGMPTLAGHKAGYEKFKEVIGWCEEEDISHVVAYVFSTENWNRATDEVSGLMTIFHSVLDELIRGSERYKNWQIRFIGDRTKVEGRLQEKMATVESVNSDASRVIYLALSYGGRDEILHAVRRVQEEDAIDALNEESFRKYLYTGDMPDPDIIIRTGGHSRLSNFLLWQAAYSELYFLDTLWPEFSRDEFRSIVDSYRGVEVNKGK